MSIGERAPAANTAGRMENLAGERFLSRASSPTLSLPHKGHNGGALFLSMAENTPREGLLSAFQAFCFRLAVVRKQKPVPRRDGFPTQSQPECPFTNRSTCP